MLSFGCSFQQHSHHQIPSQLNKRKKPSFSTARFSCVGSMNRNSGVMHSSSSTRLRDRSAAFHATSKPRWRDRLLVQSAIKLDLGSVCTGLITSMGCALPWSGARPCRRQREGSSSDLPRTHPLQWRLLIGSDKYVSKKRKDFRGKHFTRPSWKRGDRKQMSPCYVSESPWATSSQGGTDGALSRSQ